MVAAARTLLDDHGAIAGTLAEAGIDLSVIPQVLEAAHQLGQRPPAELITNALERAELKREGLAVTLKFGTLIHTGNVDADTAAWQISRSFPMTLQRRGLELKLVVPTAGRPSEPEADRALFKALARSRQWFDDLASGRAASMSALARQAGLSRRYVARLLPLAFLAPVIVEAIVSGHPPSGPTAEQLTRRIALPLDWSEQQRALGVD